MPVAFFFLLCVMIDRVPILCCLNAHCRCYDFVVIMIRRPISTSNLDMRLRTFISVVWFQCYDTMSHNVWFQCNEMMSHHVWFQYLDKMSHNT